MLCFSLLLLCAQVRISAFMCVCIIVSTCHFTNTFAAQTRLGDDMDTALFPETPCLSVYTACPHTFPVLLCTGASIADCHQSTGIIGPPNLDIRGEDSCIGSEGSRRWSSFISLLLIFLTDNLHSKGIGGQYAFLLYTCIMRSLFFLYHLLPALLFVWCVSVLFPPYAFSSYSCSD